MDTYQYCIERKEMRRLGVYEASERGPFKGTTRDRHLSNKLILRFALALNHGLVLILL